jgi:Na+-driven multidrug efflux pump
MAVAFAVAPLAAQNFGAGDAARVRESFRTAAWMGSSTMLALTLLCQWRPGALIAAFTGDPAVIETGGHFLQIVSWNFVASGLIFTCSGMFQAMGHTLPALLSSASRLLTFVLPGVLLAGAPGFTLGRLWALSVASVALQAILSLFLVRAELAKRLSRLLPAGPTDELFPAPVTPKG